MYQGLFSWLFFQQPTDNFNVLNRETVRNLEKKIDFLYSVLRKNHVPEEEYRNDYLPVIYVITPTYARPQQKAELTRLLNIFLLVPSIHWIVVEDSNFKTKLVSNFLYDSGLPYTHLNVLTPSEWKLHANDPNWYKPRGVLQRNAGLTWLRESIHVKTASGVVYFADDDNTYSTQLFKEMRWTSKVSVWPVGLVGGAMVERPAVSGNKVIGWKTAWRSDRPFATDMAGFAVNLELILKMENVMFVLTSKRGFMESDFLEKLVTKEDLEPKADKCTKVYVWHTRTEKVDLKQEIRLIQENNPSDRKIEV